MPMPDYSRTHTWVIAAIYPVSDKQAFRAVLRHSVIVAKGERLEALETYCSQCRRPWDDVADELCEAYESNEHLRGGPIGERKKRKHRHDCAAFGCERDDDGGEAVAAAG